MCLKFLAANCRLGRGAPGQPDPGHARAAANPVRALLIGGAGLCIWKGNRVLDLLAQIFRKEALRHPLFFLLCFIAAGGLVGTSFHPFVMAETFQEYQEATRSELADFKRRLGGLETGVCSLQYTTQKAALEQAIRATESEIFQLERVEAAGEATARDLLRLDFLRTEKGRLTRELQEILRRSNCEPR